MSDYANLSQKTGLEHLTDKELIHYYELVKNLGEEGKRHSNIHLQKCDTKKMYHLVRLLLEVEQIMAEGDLDLQRNSVILNSIRNGEWELERLESWFQNKEKSLETLYAESKLPERPKEGKIKTILMECLEMHYKDLNSIITVAPEVNAILSDLETIISKYKV